MTALDIPLANSTTVKKRRGRPSSPDSLVFVTVGLSSAQWEWLKLWFPTGSLTDALRSLVDRAMRFWPLGPFVFGHSRKPDCSGGQNGLL